MSFNIIVNSSTDKIEKYKTVIKNITEIINDESNIIANLANVASLLKYSFDYYLWVGFYLYSEKESELVLGPFQGKLACTRIGRGKGVCGSAIVKGESIIVNDVNAFPGHIFCDPESKSEIVVPIIKNNIIFGVLDVDSKSYGSFDETDKMYLEEVVNIISKKF